MAGHPRTGNRPLTEHQKEDERNVTRRRAGRHHQGSGHWHVEKRSSVIICGNCQARIPRWKNPQFCPECDEGKPHS